MNIRQEIYTNSKKTKLLYNTAQEDLKRNAKNAHQKTQNKTYVNISSNFSPSTPSICLTHFLTSLSTSSSSSSISSLIYGNISGKSANHSSPSCSVSACSVFSAATRVCGLSPPADLALKPDEGRRNFMSVELSSLWLSVESAAMPSSVMAGMVSVITVVAVEVDVAWASWEIKGWEIWVRWEGDCQNSKES